MFHASDVFTPAWIFLFHGKNYCSTISGQPKSFTLFRKLSRQRENSHQGNSPVIVGFFLFRPDLVIFTPAWKLSLTGMIQNSSPPVSGIFTPAWKFPSRGNVRASYVIIVPPCFGNLHASVKIPVDGNQTVKLQNDLSHHPPDDFCLPARKACRLGASCVSCPAYCRIWCIC